MWATFSYSTYFCAYFAIQFYIFYLKQDKQQLQPLTCTTNTEFYEKKHTTHFNTHVHIIKCKFYEHTLFFLKSKGSFLICLILMLQLSKNSLSLQKHRNLLYKFQGSFSIICGLRFTYIYTRQRKTIQPCKCLGFPDDCIIQAVQHTLTKNKG